MRDRLASIERLINETTPAIRELVEEEWLRATGIIASLGDATNMGDSVTRLFLHRAGAPAKGIGR